MSSRFLLRAVPVLAVLVLAFQFVAVESLGQDPGSDTSAPEADAPEFDAAVLEPYRLPIDDLIVYALTDGEAHATLTDLCTTAPHRLSGSAGLVRAIEWAERELKEAGCDKVWLEEVTVPVWVRGEREVLRYAAKAPAVGKELPILALGGSVGTPGDGITAPVVEVGSFEELAALGDKAKGKIVFFNRSMDRAFPNTGDAYGTAVGQRHGGAIAAARVGAVAVVIRSMTTALDDEPHTGGMSYEEGLPKIPACAISTLAAEELAAKLVVAEEVVLHLRMNCKTLPPARSHNVIGEYRGSEKPDEIVLVGGHLDGWDVGHGAHDDASGSVQSIEVVRLLKGMKMRPRRTIRVVLFTNEENGLAGARAYYETHLPEMPKHVLALESDRGGFTPRGFSTDANPAAYEILEAITELVASTGAATLKQGGGGADINPMRKSGVINVGYWPDGQRYFDLHHTRADTIDKVHERELQLGAAAMAGFLYVVADLEQRIPSNSAK